MSTNTPDPLGGTYFVEALTDEMERRAYEYFAKIDQLGGMVQAVKLQLPPARDRRRGVRAAAGDRRGRADRRRRQQLRATDEEPIPTLRVDPALERKQIDRLQAARPGATAPPSSGRWRG